MVFAVVLNIYIFTYQPTAAVIFPDILIALCLGLEHKFRLSKNKGESGDDLGTSANDAIKQVRWTVIGVVAVFACNIGITLARVPNQWPPLELAAVNGTDVAYSLLMAIAETQLFQGIFLDGALTHLSRYGALGNPIFIITAVAGGITGYHLARYGDSPSSLTFVFTSFWVINYIAYKTRSLGPPTLIHSTNNLYSALGLGLFAASPPAIASSLTLFATPALAVAAVAVLVTTYNRKLGAIKPCQNLSC